MARKTKENPSAVNSAQKTTPIAIVGMGSIFPNARTTQDYWDNILRKIDCVTDVPASRWSIEDYYDPDPSIPDKTYCKRGGFIPDVDFDPMQFGLPPNILEVTDISQLLSLLVAREALEDAGYTEKADFDREHTGCILGFVGMSSKLFTPLMTRLQYPVWERVLLSAGLSQEDADKIIAKIKLAYINWEENSFPGAIGNVIAGRICNRFDLGGTNCVVDAACASSLAAVKMAIGELIQGHANVMLTGGVDTDNSINTYMCFSKTPAFTKKEKVRPFDIDSGGMMVGEGLGMLVLKRLEDAERDGDRVYAIIRAIGTSSDGRFKSIYAPRPAGQALALRRAYVNAGFLPSSVGLIEAHGTGTIAGDPAEFSGLNEVFGEGNPRKQHIALGSVKSQIAHTKAAAGVASLIKASLALYHKVLPATINVTQPDPKYKIETTPFYLNTQTRPWIRAECDDLRRAGVSAFGFGGTNYHVVLEEYEREHSGEYRLNRVAQQVILSAATPEDLLAACLRAYQDLQGDLAQVNFVNLSNSSRKTSIPPHYARIGFIAETPDEATQALRIILESLPDQSSKESWEHPKGIYYRKDTAYPEGSVVALFSGQGSQYLEMGRELAVNFPEMREVFSALDGLFLADGLSPLSERVFPRPVFDPKQTDVLNEILTQTEFAQPAIGGVSVGLFKLLRQAGFRADFTAGHSFGELTALWAAGVLGDRDYFTLAKARGKAMSPPADPDYDAGTMMAVKGNVDKIRGALNGDDEVILANWNSDQQVVIAGSKPDMKRAQNKLSKLGFQVIPLPVSAAFHTPLVEHARAPFSAEISRVEIRKPKIPVFSNSTGKAYSTVPDEIREQLENHILKPVLFRDEIENIYASGGRIFVEFGPKNILTNLIDNILGGRPHLAIALNASPKKDSDRQLREAVVALRVAGLPLTNFDPYAVMSKVKASEHKSAVTVSLNGGYYVSQKTRNAFEDALIDGFHIHERSDAQQEIRAKSSAPSTGQAVHQKFTAIPDTVLPNSIDVQPMRSTMSYLQSSTPEYDVVAEFQSHQTRTAQMHEQYLRIEEEYARALTQIVSLQAQLFNRSSHDLQAMIPLFESLERNLARFHDHQAETLKIHRNFLEIQANFSGSFWKIIPQQHNDAPVVIHHPASPVPETVTRISMKDTTVRLQSYMTGTNGHSQAGHSIPASQPSTTVPPSYQEIPIMPAVEQLQVSLPTIRPVAINSQVLKSALFEIVSEKTGYPVETLEMDMDMEADLGIDSIKRVEILGTIQDRFPELPRLDSAVLAELRTLGQIVEMMESGQDKITGFTPDSQSLAAASPVSKQSEQLVTQPIISEVTRVMLEVVSEKTGYPTETLELDMDMEADLGIDSIKRVEIMGAIQDHFPDLPKVEINSLIELRTLGQIIKYLGQPEQPVADLLSDGGTASSPFDLPVDTGVPQKIVIRKFLPVPDRLEFDLPENHVCLITDEGTSVTSVLVEQLLARRWQVAVLRFPSTFETNRVLLPAGAIPVELTDWSEAALQTSLSDLTRQYGPTALFIHLGGHTTSASGSVVVQFSEQEKALVKMVFLAAKHLQASLVAAAEQGRSVFMTVTRLDGEFGMSGQSTVSPVSGGLFGLVKTLNLEWERVFCRAVDLHPDLDVGRSVECILAELDDPNRLVVEVGYTHSDRSTLALLPLEVA